MNKTNNARPEVVSRATTECEPHVLDDIRITNQSSNWRELMRQWQRPMTLSERLNFIRGMSTPIGNGIDQFIWLLKVADRYQSEVFRTVNADPRQILHANRVIENPQAKSLISICAMKILCSHFFKVTDSMVYPHRLAYEEPLFSNLMWFFRPMTPGLLNNLSCRSALLGKDEGAHYREVLHSFASDFARNLWQMLNRRFKPYWDLPTNYEFVDVAKHQKAVTDLMFELGAFNGLGYMIDTSLTPTREVFEKMFADYAGEWWTLYTNRQNVLRLFSAECSRIPHIINAGVRTRHSIAIFLHNTYPLVFN